MGGAQCHSEGVWVGLHPEGAGALFERSLSSCCKSCCSSETFSATATQYDLMCMCIGLRQRGVAGIPSSSFIKAELKTPESKSAWWCFLLKATTVEEPSVCVHVCSHSAAAVAATTTTTVLTNSEVVLSFNDTHNLQCFMARCL